MTSAAVDLLTALVEQFAKYCDVLLSARVERQLQIDQGILPDFMSETVSIRKDDWKIQGIPVDLLDHRVEITGPVERKIIINALNTNVKVFMVDFEDSLSLTWEKLIKGQINFVMRLMALFHLLMKKVKFIN